MGGCFSFIKFRDLSSTGQTGSVELAMRTAPLQSPSSSFEETRLASEAGVRVPVAFLGLWLSLSSSMARFTFEARLLLWPPRLGMRTQHLLNRKSRSQASVSSPPLQ